MANTLRVANIGTNWGENFRSLLDSQQSINGVARFDITTFRTQLIHAIETNNFSSTDPKAIEDWLLGPNNDGNDGHLVFAPHLYGSQVAGSDAYLSNECFLLLRMQRARQSPLFAISYKR